LCQITVATKIVSCAPMYARVKHETGKK
jgi:hypothetical protein